jgi:hypothetical protein
MVYRDKSFYAHPMLYELQSTYSGWLPIAHGIKEKTVCRYRAAIALSFEGEMVTEREGYLENAVESGAISLLIVQLWPRPSFKYSRHPSSGGETVRKVTGWLCKQVYRVCDLF